jgi:hypothetical protein
MQCSIVMKMTSQSNGFSRLKPFRFGQQIARFAVVDGGEVPPQPLGLE